MGSDLLGQMFDGAITTLLALTVGGLCRALVLMSQTVTKLSVLEARFIDHRESVDIRFKSHSEWIQKVENGKGGTRTKD